MADIKRPLDGLPPVAAHCGSDKALQHLPDFRLCPDLNPDGRRSPYRHGDDGEEGEQTDTDGSHESVYPTPRTVRITPGTNFARR